MVEITEVYIDDVNKPSIGNGEDIVTVQSGWACGVGCENGMVCGLGCGHGVGGVCGTGCSKG